MATTKHGFQAAIVIYGNFVNKEISLAFQHTMTGAIGIGVSVYLYSSDLDYMCSSEGADAMLIQK